MVAVIMTGVSGPLRSAVLSMHYKGSDSSPRMVECGEFRIDVSLGIRENSGGTIGTERAREKAAGAVAIFDVADAVVDDEIFFFAAGFPLQESEHENSGGEHERGGEESYRREDHEGLDGVDGVSDIGVG